MNILGVSCYYHDSACCLLKDGDIVACAEEERFTRKKHDYDFPSHAIDFCLKKGGISGKDLDWVVFYEKPFLKLERIFVNLINTFPRSHRLFPEILWAWIKEKLWIKIRLARYLGIEEEKILFLEHHLSHASSCFYPSPFKESAILTVDGVGEWATCTMGVGKDKEIKILKEIHFPHSLGLLYSTFTAFLGFQVNEGEYKVMGMAPYGKPRYREKMDKLVKVYPDASFELNLDYFAYPYSLTYPYSRKFIDLFGEPRKKEESHILDPHYADIAATIQKFTEELMLKLAHRLYEETKLPNLCLAGGVALNCVANGRIIRETPFKNIFIQPSAGDGGGAMGACLYVYHALLGNERKFVLENVYLGEEYGEEEIKKDLEEEGIAYHYFEKKEELLEKVVDDLCEGKVVGWFQGRFEFGPRALGNRSILADPRKKEMKEIVNRKVKFREPFRPFAPSVIQERVKDFFEVEELYPPLKFMLLTFPVKEKERENIPAITHVDGSARLQVVSEKDNPIYWRLLKKFEERTGYPLLLNTSFNLKGEPIVNTPKEAISTFSRSGLDVLVMGKFYVSK
ncbi:MAG TPA: hypothetical protein ENG13_05600 [bacterium]|nr:hypothetical protein [bacterium]HEX68516.1 hypothetical protein [bacterium]